MTQEKVSPLRARIIEEMQIKGLGESSQKAHIRAVRYFAEFLGRSPDHPHIHMIVPGRGLAPDGTRWISCKPGFFLHVRVLSRLYRRLFVEGLKALHRAGLLKFPILAFKIA